MSETTRYPLSWPTGWPRTDRYKRQRASFARSQKAYDTNTQQTVYAGKKSLTVFDAIKRLSGELGRLGAVNEILSTNVETRLDGLPRSNQSEPSDPGAAVYFKLKGKDIALACDKWSRVADNIAALAQHIDALRRIDRYGVGRLEQAFAGYAALPSRGSTWRTTLGFAPDQSVSRAQIDAAFRERSRTAHPDVQGGSHDAMASLSAAKIEALQEVAS